MPLMTMALETTDAIFTPPNSQDVTLLEIVVKVVEIVWIVFVAISIVMFIIAGVFFMTAQGDPKATASTRSTLTFAILGLVSIILAYFILDILARFTGLPEIKQFEVPQP